MKDDINMYTVFEIIQLFFSADCGPPPEIANGSPIVASPVAGTTAIYLCDFGATLLGNNTITCQDDGTWEDPPMCVLPSECMNYNYYALAIVAPNHSA